MSDPKRPPHAFDFRCACGKTGAWGEGVSLRSGEIGTWYCEDCVPERLCAPEGWGPFKGWIKPQS